ncbi:hypothetical protein [Streptomyces sp. NBC_01750]|uniref:hypothetical protein n=1 Tax=Streptomyces sp. NBC_01750 TaxID=2975928 RepID=UPI002DD80065|nr:hypothetical protein [Streptomyces sp. NBC_01750]WSD30818.1 hypothetical protein OG966_01930 [Streptomyces sp. NBC_01750]
MNGRSPRTFTRTLALTALPTALLMGAPATSTALLAPGGPRARATTRADATAGRPGNVLWVLQAGRLVLHGSAFHGVVTVPTAAGPLRALKFTARSLDIGDLDLAAGRDGVMVRLRAKPATTSTIKGKGKGVVTLYTRKLSGTVTGLGGAPLPADRSVTVTPDALPSWLSHTAVPTRTVAFENVTVSQVAQIGGDLSITGSVLYAADE